MAGTVEFLPSLAASSAIAPVEFQGRLVLLAYAISALFCA
jgi:hypothetical protein